MFNLRINDFSRAIDDISGGFRDWRVWHHLAMQEVRQRYRRSTLGPFWISITLGVQVTAMGFLVGFLLNVNFGRFLPYLAVGFVVWTFWMTTIIEGSLAFVGAAGTIVQVKRSLSTYLIQTLWRNTIVLAHTAIVFVVVFAIYGVTPNSNTLYLFISIPLFALSMFWMMLLLGTVSVRFRDVPVILQNVMTVLFWTTPIFYFPAQLGDKRIIADVNPLTHIIDIIRKPLLGEAPSELNWMYVSILTAVGCLFTLLFFARFRARIPYWI